MTIFPDALQNRKGTYILWFMYQLLRNLSKNAKSTRLCNLTIKDSKNANLNEFLRITKEGEKSLRQRYRKVINHSTVKLILKLAVFLKVTYKCLKVKLNVFFKVT